MVMQKGFSVYFNNSPTTLRINVLGYIRHKVVDKITISSQLPWTKIDTSFLFPL